MKYIGAFLSANDLEEKYTQPAKELGKLLAENGYGLVWGGSDKGLMKVIADGVSDAGGKLIGISMELLRDSARENCDEMLICADLSERKKKLLERSDAFVVLVGGIGTLDEVTEILELKKHGLHNKPIVMLNTDNFYEGMKVQLQKMKDDGFINKALDDLVYFADKPEEAIEFISEKLGE